MLHQPAKILPRKRAIGNDAGVAGTIADFPRFADGDAGREMLPVKQFELASTPDAFFENGMEGQRVEHRRHASALRRELDCAVVLGILLFGEMTVSAEFVIPPFKPFGG